MSINKSIHGVGGMPRDNKTHYKITPLSYLIVIVTIVMLGVTFFSSTLLRSMFTAQSNAKFSAEGDRLTATTLASMNRYTDLLYQGRSFINGSQNVTQQEWQTFFGEQQALNRFAGISAISYVEKFDESQKDQFVRRMQSESFFGGKNFAISPAVSDNGKYAVGSLAMSNSDLSKSFGFNLISTPDRRAIYEQADNSEGPIASSSTTLKTGYKGFYVILPVRNISDNINKVLGYVLVSFHTEDVMAQLFKDNPSITSYKVADITNQSNPTELYLSKYWDAGLPFQHTNKFNFGGRTWAITYTAKDSYENKLAVEMLPNLIILIGLLSTLCVGYAMYVVRAKIALKKL